MTFRTRQWDSHLTVGSTYLPYTNLKASNLVLKILQLHVHHLLTFPPLVQMSGSWPTRHPPKQAVCRPCCSGHPRGPAFSSRPPEAAGAHTSHVLRGPCGGLWAPPSGQVAASSPRTLPAAASLCPELGVKTLSWQLLLEPKSAHSCALDSMGWTQTKWPAPPSPGGGRGPVRPTGGSAGPREEPRSAAFCSSRFIEA